MSDADRPQITLITPPVFDLDLFPAQLAAVLDSVEITSPAPPMPPALWRMPAMWPL